MCFRKENKITGMISTSKKITSYSEGTNRKMGKNKIQLNSNIV